jgi:FAD/FMN-containing dehydrogenase
MATSDLAMTFPTLSQTSQAIFQTHNQIFRWSNTHISPNSCAAIVVPSTEQDINAVIKFASQNRLKVLPTAGKHGSSLPINERSIYLDLKNFDQIELDEQNGSVTIGGGVLAGRLCDVLAERGWYCSK